MGMHTAHAFSQTPPPPAARAARTAANAATTPGSLEAAAVVPVDAAATLYFVVFPCNCAPIFHSNRIPLVEDAPPYAVGDVVYLGRAEEVAQQKLQELAFPLGFGCKSAELRSGPLWSCRLESVRKKGEVRYHRLMITSTFVVLVASESGELRTMQTKYAAAALVITCPPDTSQYQFLVENFDSVVRNMLHIALDFAMEAAQLFFVRLSRTTPAEQLMAELEKHPSALRTYHTLGAVLANAFGSTHTIPRLHSRIGELTVTSPPRTSSSKPQHVSGSVGSLLYDALGGLCRFSEEFATSVVAGLLSLSNWEGCGLVRFSAEDKQQQLQQQSGDKDIYSDYWREMEEQEAKKVGGPLSGVQEECNTNDIACPCRSGAPQKQQKQQPDTSSSPMVSSAMSATVRSAHASDTTATGGDTIATCPLSSQRVGRVVIFCTDPDLARSLLITAAFFFRDRCITAGASLQSREFSPFAGKVESCAYPSLPVQWVMEEYDPNRADPLLCLPHTVENALLIIAPRTLLCRRLRFSKTFTSNPILVERFKERHQLVHPFQRQTLEAVQMLPDDTIRAVLRQARWLQKSSGGAVSCAEFLESSMVRLMRHSRACRLLLREHLNHNDHDHQQHQQQQQQQQQEELVSSFFLGSFGGREESGSHLSHCSSLSYLNSPTSLR
ncbi:hypothetical protein DQ04_10291010 [Trypanosoma grayi]|uniref:hypothetical protein n=1 Tax=Trypanosoma grayi TaxID=71804 RepID=UPI0004F48406|nr:hypothetical protein DQ04_10291010 [Trypanosoma grayi]KEG07289.1 hypothetical protein DQ04_10291010 [Trypanosoma grayi]